MAVFAYLLLRYAFFYYFCMVFGLKKIDRVLYWSRTTKNKRIMRTKSFFVITLCLLALPFVSVAQTDSTGYGQTYNDFMGKALREYEQFKQKAYADFERFLAEAWAEYRCFSSDSCAYSASKPETIPAHKRSSGVIDIKAPYVTNDMEVMPEIEPTNVNDRSLDGMEESNEVYISFYGKRMTFQLPQDLRITAQSTKESGIARYYEAMRTHDKTHSLQKELDQAVASMGLNDWGYFALLRCISEKAFTQMNDRVLFCFYMLHSHGFKARVARGQKSGQLKLLLALDNSKEVYSYTFFVINKVKYYAVFGGGQKGENAYSYNEKADDKGLKDFGLDFKRTLNIASCDKTRTLHMAKTNTDIVLPYSTSHLRYYDDIPLTVIPVYCKTALAPETEAVLTQTFGTLSKKYNKVQLVDIILNFVQTAFQYQIDEKQFGREKYFFPEEVIGYPYSDCEDRAALFAWLVKRYTGCEVVGVLYPDHLATAVYFGDGVKVPGKGFDQNGKHFVFCDPTYTNAPIGTIMQKYDGKEYEVVKM